MNFLFVHQCFPSQFEHVVRHLAMCGHKVLFLTQQRRACRVDVPGVQKIVYHPARLRSRPHRYLTKITEGVANGQAVASHAERLKGRGFDPHLIVGHSGWGEILYLKDVWPNSPLLGYFEHFWRAHGSDLDFDREFPQPDDAAARIRTRSAIDLLSLEAADGGLTATRYQRSTYPRRYWNHLRVIHEGVDASVLRPDPQAQVWLSSGVSFTAGDEVVTYSARSLEPHRGFHIFMRALPVILKRRPRAHAVIVGGDQVCYDRRPLMHRTYHEQLMAEVGDKLDPHRVHFVGRLPYRRYQAILQVSSVHVYFTYPFVLSWSLIEAMAIGCLIVGSRTPPVEEVISDGENGLLTGFFDPEGLADRVCYALRNRHRLSPIRLAARKTALRRFDLKTVCLPAQIRLYESLTGRGISLRCAGEQT
jgi:glycosyltransferase involved in cell wall biosynthesis